MSESNKLTFKNLISPEDWSDIMNENDTQAAFTKFHKLYKSMYDKAFPVIKVKFKYNNQKPWLSDELKDSIKLKNKLYKKSIKFPSLTNIAI